MCARRMNMNMNMPRRRGMKPKPQKLVLIYCRRTEQPSSMPQNHKVKSEFRDEKKKRIARLDMVIFVSADPLKL